ncbi:MAG: hypothetical protein IT473_16555 [Lysobacter sp.]|nr:hypothetical protein [Lysobacter sp.]
MRISKIAALSVAVLAVGGVVAGLQAYPAPAAGYETYVLYYNNAAHTTQVGARGIAHDAACQTWHITWGVATPYSRVLVTKCPVIILD